MGIVITYQGTLPDMTRLDSLLADVRQYCEQTGWRFKDLNIPLSGIVLLTAEEFMNEPVEESEPIPVPALGAEMVRVGPMSFPFDPKNPRWINETWRGVMASPPGTESFKLTFDSQGRLCNFLDVSFNFKDGPFKEEEFFVFTPLFCKTTGQVEQHVAICVLLRMLKERYMPDLKVSDEGGYFGSWDLEQLKREHGHMVGLIDSFRDPERLKRLFEAAGLDAEGLEQLPTKLELPIETPGKAKKATIH